MIPSPDKLLVVGGGLSPTGELTPDAQSRVETAVQHYRKMGGGVVVFSGGVSWAAKEESLPEAEVMAGVAVDLLDLPEDDIILETRSTNTISNIALSASYLEGFDPVGIVTQKYHIPRCLKVGRRVLEAPVVGLVAPALDEHSRRQELVSTLMTGAVLLGTRQGDVETIIKRNDTLTRHTAHVVRSIRGLRGHYQAAEQA